MNSQARAHPFVIPVLSAANFMIGMGAFMVVGLLAPVAEDFGITVSAAGWLMTFYALGYAILSPLLVSLTGAVGRRRILAAGLGTFALANLGAALSPNDTVLFAMRILAAAGAGLITPVAAAVAASLSPPERRARALSAVFFGLTLSQVMGVPVGGFIAYTFGWRTAFALVFVLTLPVIWLIWVRVPAGLTFQPVTLRDLGRAMAQAKTVLAVSFTSVFVGAMYIVYTYLSPLLSATMGYGRDGITTMLLAYGLGAVIGNLVGGQATDRIGPGRTLAILACAQMALLPLLSLLPMPDLALLALVVLWSGFGWSFTAAQQVRLIALDPGGASVLLALNAAAIYIGAAVGSAIGAGIIALAGLNALGVAGAFGALAALIVLVLGERITPHARSA